MLKMQKTQIIAASFIFTMTACTSSDNKIPVNEQFDITIDRTQKSKIRTAKLSVDDDEKFNRGFVGRGNNSHVPKYFMGHIDFVISSNDGVALHSGRVKLRSRQTAFSYKLPQNIPQGANINLVYSK